MNNSAHQAIVGSWAGGCAIGQRWTYLEVHFTTDTLGTRGTIDMRFEGEVGLEIGQVDFEAPRVRFELSRAGDTWVFDGLDSDGLISGTVTAAQEQGVFQLLAVAEVDHAVYDTYVGSYQLQPDRIISIANFRGEAGCPYPVYLDLASGRIGALFPTSATTFVAGPAFLMPFPTEAHVTFVADSQGDVTGLRWRRPGDAERWAPRTLLQREQVSCQSDTITLAGTLTTPVAKPPYPAIVLIHGSGDQRRDHAFLQFIADLFASHGIAVLAYDKRGVGGSTGDSDIAMLEDLAADALAGVAFLQTRGDIKHSQVGLWGISQGGWIAPLAAARSPNVAFIILVSGPAVSVVVQDVDRVEHELRAGGFAEDQVQAAVAHERLFSEVAFSGQGWDRLEASIEHARATRWASIVALPSKEEFERYGSLWGQFRAYDPMPYLQQVTCPVLALFGGKDTVVPPEKNAPLMEQALKAAGNHDYTIKIFPDGEHVLLATTSGARRDVPQWKAFVPGYFEAMLDWLRARVDVIT
jgi:pimeloyl-ACP methyl ester carboxylesterase